MRQIRQDVSLIQQQKLFMTTELRQAISILQMSAVELSEYIVQKIEENPFLEEGEITSNTTDDTTEIHCNRISIDDVIEYWSDKTPSHTSSEQYKSSSWDNYLSEKPSLYEHLECQLYMEVKNPTDILIGNYLIGSIDSNGYLCTNLVDVANILNINIHRVSDVLEVIQDFHPAGIGARCLQECLLIQLKSYGKHTPLLQCIIEEYVQEIAEKKFNKIANDLSVSVQKVQEAYDIIRTLDPKPGLQFGSDRNPMVWPDVSIIKNHDGYTVVVNDLDFLYLRINNTYANLYRQSVLSEDAYKFLTEKFESALGLIRGIEQRRLNVYKVVKCIADIQYEFFERGIEFLKPLTMNRVAEMVNLHESTVSRVVCNKYVQTPRGLYPLKFFFNSGLDSADSETVCSKSIKYLIQEIVNHENPIRPFSDQEIMEILHDKGIKISRRTINKYRQGMGIPSNSLRKRY